jgi:hypothetical protein
MNGIYSNSSVQQSSTVTQSNRTHDRIVRAIKRSSVALAILALLATFAIFVPPAHQAFAAGSPTISFGYSGTSATLVGQNFTPGSTVYLGTYKYVNGQWQLRSSAYVTAGPAFCMTLIRLGGCAPAGTFTYTLPGNLNAYTCDNAGYGYSFFAYDYTTGWSNSLSVYECIH